MKCQGNFTFKSLEYVDKGSFVNGNGQKVEYAGSYKLNVDEWNEGKLNQLKLKVPEDSTELVNQLRLLRPYQEIILECDVRFYNSVPKIVPIGFKKVDSNNK